MADKNQITLVGKVGSAVKRGKTQNGDGYLAFLLEIQSKETANSSANNYHQYISIRVFRAPVIKYLDKVAGSEAMREKILREIEEAYKKGGVIETMKIIRELKGDKQII